MFFPLSFMKNKLCNKLTNHLDLVMHVFVKKNSYHNTSFTMMPFLFGKRPRNDMVITYKGLCLTFTRCLMVFVCLSLLLQFGFCSNSSTLEVQHLYFYKGTNLKHVYWGERVVGYNFFCYVFWYMLMCLGGLHGLWM